MNFTGEISSVNMDVVTRETTITFTVNERQAVLDGYDELKDCKLSVTAKKWRKKRSLDANAYFWVLAGKLAAKLGTTTTEVYRQYIREIGDNFEILPMRNDAVETFRRAWQLHGMGWICDSLGDSKLTGYTNLCCYYGSSTYDTAQMSHLIDLIVQDCKEQGIETMTPDEIEIMKARWNDAEHLADRS